MDLPLLDLPSGSAAPISIPVTALARIEAMTEDARVIVFHCHDMRILALDFRWETTKEPTDAVRCRAVIRLPCALSAFARAG
jgi:hypothetical protein